MPSNQEPLRSFASFPPEAPSEVVIEYDSRGRRVQKAFTDAYEARSFFARHFSAGHRPRVLAPRRAKGRGGVPAFGGMPGEEVVVERIRQLRAEGLSLQKIAEALDAEKLPTRSGAKWSKMAIKNVLDRLPR